MILGISQDTSQEIDQEAAAEIGMIWKTEIWDDVTVPGNLLTKTQSRLRDLAQGVTCHVTLL